MYSLLPRWSEGSNNGVLPVQRAAAPLASSAAPPVMPATKTSRTGRQFVNHNVASAPPTSSSTSTSVALPAASPRLSTGKRSSAQRPAARSSAPDTTTASAAGGYELPDTSSPVYGAARPAYATDRRGIVRGITMQAIGDAARDVSGPSLGIEGVQTGEEVTVEATVVRRRSNVTGSSAGGGGGAHEAVQLQQLRRQLEKGSADVKAMAAANRRQKQEQQQHKAAFAIQLGESEARLRHVQAHLLSRERLLSECLTGVVAKLHREIDAQVAVALATARAHSSERATWAEERAALLKELEAARAAAANQPVVDAAGAANDEEVDQLRAQLETLRRLTAEQLRSLEERLTGTQTELQAASAELARYRQERDRQNFLVAQCRLFIQHVCQPGFSVVKGPSLEPVEKERPEPTGFVLVPLTVLLHGYALLPEGDRQAVIDHYDGKAKAL